MNSNNDLISIIMPAYNRSNVIQYAINSVLSQTYGNFELIIIDDASTDNTYDISLSYAQKDDRVIVIQNCTNSRTSPIQWEPRNDGLRRARGEYICYLDSDNTWDNRFLDKMKYCLSCSKQHKLAYCNSKNYYKTCSQFKKVVSEDNRTLKYYNFDTYSAAFSCSDIKSGLPGIDWYIDTNEIMHKSDVFLSLGHLWPIIHPNRTSINKSQTISRPYRRHNDQYLIELIISTFGYCAITHIDEELVSFYYHTRKRI